jgi:hypothetical protein
MTPPPFPPLYHVETHGLEKYNCLPHNPDLRLLIWDFFFPLDILWRFLLLA